MWSKDKRKTDMENNLEYITFSTKERKNIQKKSAEYRIIREKYINTNHKSMLAIMSAGLVDELIRFYNRDVVLNACICKCLSEKNEEKLGYYLEIYITKLMTCWEYLFTYMNHCLQTELVPNEQVKKELIESKMYDYVYIQHEQYIEIKKVPFEEKRQKEIYNRLKKELIVLTPWSLKKKISEIYEESELITQIFECYSDELVADSKHIRNTIVHSDSIQKSFSFGMNEILGGVAIRGRDKGFYKNILNKIDTNMLLLRKAILLLKKMLCEDKIPNHIENAGKKHIVYDYICKRCKKIYTIPETYEKYFLQIGCLKCGNKEFHERKEFAVSELYYGGLMGEILSGRMVSNLENNQ